MSRGRSNELSYLLSVYAHVDLPSQPCCWHANAAEMSGLGPSVRRHRSNRVHLSLNRDFEVSLFDVVRVSVCVLECFERLCQCSGLRLKAIILQSGLENAFCSSSTRHQIKLMGSFKSSRSDHLYLTSNRSINVVCVYII